MNILISLFLLAAPSLATTTLNQPGQPQKKLCEIRARFSGTKAAHVKGVRGKENHSTDLVYWNLDIAETSDTAICPKEKSIQLRIRGADFTGPPSEPKISYRVGISEPAMSGLIKAKIKHITGRESFTNRDYQEWTLVEVSND